MKTAKGASFWKSWINYPLQFLLAEHIGEEGAGNNARRRSAG